MANDYQKINTLFLRDENNIIIPDRFTASEFTYLVNNLGNVPRKLTVPIFTLMLTLSSGKPTMGLWR